MTRVTIAQNDSSMKTKMFIYKVIHFFITCGLFYFIWLLFRYKEFPDTQDVGFRYNYLITAGYAILLGFFNRTYNSYLFGYSRIRALALAQFLSQLFSVGIIYFAVSLGWNHFENPVLFIILLGLYILLDLICSYLGNSLYFYLNPPRNTILIYRNKQDRRRFGSIKGKPTERLYKIIEEIEFDGKFPDIKDKLEGYDAIFVAGVNSHCRNGILKYGSCTFSVGEGFLL